MRQSKLFTKTLRQAPKDEVSQNAIFLIRAGFIDKLMAGVYSYLPLGLITLNKIKNIIREEMNALGAQEILMPALTPKENYLKTGRWETIDVLFKMEAAGDKEYALGATHEEVVTPLVKKFASSYKDLPMAVYQIQDKFRNEPRAKSGLLRGREFSMKDLYSFHKTEEDLATYYEKAKQAYLKIFRRCGLEALVVEASGGVFSKYSHEFQVVTPYGEDNIVVCGSCGFAQNTEICSLEEGEKCPGCSSKVSLKKAIEVGNIFKLSNKFSEAFDYKYTDENGQLQPVLMGCYGIGPSRVMGVVAEGLRDDKGLVWPKQLAPFSAHLLLLSEEKRSLADKIYQDLKKKGIEVLYDDRNESAGVKLKDADLIGLPIQLLVGNKTSGKEIEYKERSGGMTGKVKIKKLAELIQK